MTNRQDDDGERIRQATREVLQTQRRERGSLIPILQQVQNSLGYLPREALVEIAAFLGATEVAVFGVASFYNQFRLTRPGKHPIKVCTGTACHMRGGNLILDGWERELGVAVGAVTPDGEFSLERVACVGCCALAPVTVVDDIVHGNVSPTRIKGLLAGLEMQRSREMDSLRSPQAESSQS